MLSLLEIVDNPRQDVPLISVLRSPLFGFTADRLAEVRSAAPTGDYYDAVTADGGEDCKDFLAILSDLRQGGRDMSGPPPGLAHLQPTECAGGLRRHG